MAKLTLPDKESLRFALLGHGYHLCALADQLLARGFPAPLIVTHPRAEHARDQALLEGDLYSDVFTLAKERNLDLVEATTVNRPALIEQLVSAGCTAAFSLSCRSIIRQPFIDALGGRVFNIHPSMLPRERGGGTFSWRILRGDPTIAATVHLIDAGIDTGGVVLQHERKLDAARPVPADYLLETNTLYVDLLSEFLDRIDSGAPLTVTGQDEAEATYLPRLHTETNGAVDWAWDAADVDAFIRAFATPYPGAFSFIGERRISILAGEPSASGERKHPYLAGRPFRWTDDGAVHVHVADGSYAIQQVAIDGHACAPHEVIGQTDVLFTPPAVLAAAHAQVVGVRDMAPPKS